MTAYRQLGELNTELGLSDLAAQEEKVYSTHRRVFDTNTSTLMIAAQMTLTPVQKRQVAVNATRKKNKLVRTKAKEKGIQDIEALFRRQKRAARDQTTVDKEKAAVKQRKLDMQMNQRQ